MRQPEKMSSADARTFSRFSVMNAAIVKRALPCGCEPYADVFTYRRWLAQGYQVQKGQHAIKLALVKSIVHKDEDTGEESTRRLLGSSAVFCRCQVKDGTQAS